VFWTPTGGRYSKTPNLTALKRKSTQQPSLVQAEAQFRQSQSLVQEAQAAYFPTATGTATANRFVPPAVKVLQYKA